MPAAVIERDRRCCCQTTGRVIQHQRAIAAGKLLHRSIRIGFPEQRAYRSFVLQMSPSEL